MIYGFYSATSAKRLGTRIWRTPDGREVEITAVDDNEQTDPCWPDEQCVGPVTEVLREGRPTYIDGFKL